MNGPSEHHEPPFRGLPPPQFGLRALFWAMTLLCAYFALMTWLGTLWSVALGFFALLVIAHVAGNVLGSQLRDGHKANVHRAAQPLQRPPPHTLDWPPTRTTRLQQKRPVGWIMLLVGGLGAVGGGLLGGVFIALHYSDRITPEAIIVGTIASGVLGGLAGFLTSSFVGVTAHAWWQSVHDHGRAKD